MGRFDCRGILRTMSDFIDGDLGKEVCQDVEDHLTTCRKCRFHVDAVKFTIKMFDEWRADDMPPDAMIRLREKLHDETGCFREVTPPRTRRGDSGGKSGSAASKKAGKKPVRKKTAAGKSRAGKAARKSSRRRRGTSR